MKAESYFLVCVCHIVWVLSSVNVHLRGSHLLAIVNNAAMYIEGQIPQDLVFSSLGHLPRCGIAGSYGNSNLSFLRDGHTAILYSPQQGPRVPISPHPNNTCVIFLFFFFFLIVASLMGMRGYPVVVLMCIFLTTSDGEPLFVRFLAIYVSSSQKFNKCFWSSVSCLSTGHCLSTSWLPFDFISPSVVQG